MLKAGTGRRAGLEAALKQPEKEAWACRRGRPQGVRGSPGKCPEAGIFRLPGFPVSA
jgi:hypothetical protein